MPTSEELAAEVVRLAGRLDRCEAVLEIQSLKARYGELVDDRFPGGRPAAAETLAGLAERIASLFTEDGVWDGGPVLGEATGRPAIAARLAQPTLSFARHLFANPRISVEDDRAVGRWDLLSPCRRQDDSSWWVYGYEDDEYARVDGTWLHKSMRFTTVFVAPVGAGWERVLV